MNKIERLKLKRDNLKVELGILENAKEKLTPILKQYDCNNLDDIRKSLLRLKKQIKKLNSTSEKLKNKADDLLKTLEEETNDE